MRMGLEPAIIKLCGRLPRGGFKLARAARCILPGLAEYRASVKFGDFTFEGDIAHNVFFPLAVSGYYAHQAVEDDVLAEIAHRSAVIADVGGNIGYTAALMALFTPNARIIVFEPLPLCLPYLQQVSARFHNVSIVAKAVGEVAGRTKFI